MPFPSRLGGTRLLHVTDDWLAAADLIGFSQAFLRQSLESNIESANIITAVSEGLASKISDLCGRPVEVLPNGCRRPGDTVVDLARRRPIAALVGQLNERLNLDALESLADTGTKILVLGPRSETDPSTARRLDALLCRRNVDWRGQVAPWEVPQLLQTVSVGLTPYADTEFNRSSFPLKTLEYLAAGVPVVATDLPSTRWVDCSAIAIARSPSEFAGLVQATMATSLTLQQRKEMHDVANSNSWGVRADCVRSMLGRNRQSNEGSPSDTTPRRS
ncbi:glycosyltransferase [Arthrobacter sp. StoSoilA2]|uniref:glycosyltransferase n=1 Tax=Arthrobacter sp. StoSoilA2 TaxID=2830990 RepID=UPI001CC34CBB|nr:glycosyltransferase [Arthrobacter sp. StoSoilA2]